MTNSDLIHIATITSAHGIRGEVKLFSYASPPEAVFDCPKLTDNKGNHYLLSKRSNSGKAFIVALKGVTDRNSAETLKDLQLFAPKEDVSTDPLDALLHLPAKLSDGSDYGVVVDVANFGAGDVIEIELSDGTLEMLPLDERFIETHEKYVVVHPPEYVEEEK